MKKRQSGIQRKIILLFVVLLTPFTVLCIGQQIRYYRLMNESINEYTYQFVDKIDYDLEKSITALDTVQMDLFYSPEIIEFMQDPTDDKKKKTIDDLLNATKNRLRDNTASDCNVVLLNNSQKLLASTYPDWTGIGRSFSPEWFDKMIRADRGRVMISAYIVRREDGSSVKVVGLGRLVKSSEKRCGYQILEIPLEYFYSHCSGIQLGQNGWLMLVDNDNLVLYCTDSDRIGRRLTSEQVFPVNNIVLERGPALIYSKTMVNFDGALRIVASLPRSHMENMIRTLLLQAILLILSVVAVLVAAVAFASRRICKPILSVCGAMQQFEHGDFDVKVPVTAKDEIGLLQRGFNHMASRVQNTVEQDYLVPAKEREAQIKELMGIMNPHFLYNTLETISMNAYLENDIRTMEMLNKLADMCRYYSRQGDFITIREELKNASDYVELISLRWEDNIQLVQHIDERLLECQCPKYIFQPLIENSFIHGFGEGADKKGIVEITGVLNDNSDILIRVADNGTGMTPDEIKNLEASLYSDSGYRDPHNALAIKNINDRIRLAYGKLYGLHIRANENRGVCIEILLPHRTEKGSEIINDIYPDHG